MTDDNAQPQQWDLWEEAVAELQDGQRLASLLEPWMDDEERYTSQCQQVDRVAGARPQRLLQTLSEEEELTSHVRGCPYCRLRVYASLGLEEAARYAGVLDQIQRRAWGGRAARELADHALDSLVNAAEAAPSEAAPGADAGELEVELMRQLVAPMQDDLMREALDGIADGAARGEGQLWDFLCATIRPRMRQAEATLDPERCLVQAFEELLMLLRTGALESPSAGDLARVLTGALDRGLAAARARRPADGAEVISLAEYRERAAEARRAAAEEVGQALAGLEEFRAVAGEGPGKHTVWVEGQTLDLQAIQAQHSGGGLVVVVLEEDGGSDLLVGKGVLLRRQGVPMGYGGFDGAAGRFTASVWLTQMDLAHRPVMFLDPGRVLAHFVLEVVDGLLNG